MNEVKYSAGADKFSFWFVEMTKVCELRRDGMTIRTIKQKNKETDIFAVRTPEYSNTIMSVIAKRLNAGGGSFVPLFLRSDERGQKQLCLITCLLTDPLFYDFACAIIGDKLSSGARNYDNDDIERFWSCEQAKSQKVAKFKTPTLKNLTRTYKRYLANAGITDDNRGIRRIYPPVISNDIARWIQHKRITYVLYALTGSKDGKSSMQPKN